MRCFALLLAVCLIFLPYSLRAADDEPYKQAEKLAMQERYEEAVQLMQQFDVPNDPYKWVQSKIGLCVTYSLWGKDAEALDACNQAYRHHFFQNGHKCLDVAKRQKPPASVAKVCPTDNTRYDLMFYLNQWQILVYWRGGQREEAERPMTDASLVGKEDFVEELFVMAIFGYMLRDFKIVQEEYQRQGKDTAPLEHLRIVFTYGGASTPAGRAVRTARILWTEQPYTKPAVYTFAAILLCAAIYIPARRPLNRLAIGLLFTSASLLQHGIMASLALASGALIAGRSLSRHVSVWLHPARPASSPSSVATPDGAPSRVHAWLRPAARPVAVGTGAPAPAYAPPPPAPMPMYYNYRYPNQAYRIAGYCFAAFWLVLFGPLVVALLLPAFTLLADFSTKGFQNAYAHFWSILTASLTWARLWFALLLFSLLGFIGFKLYGRFSLPKRMRPPIRVVYGTLRFAFVGAILTGVGTFLSYFTATFTGLYSNPLIKMLISIIRNLLGF